MLGSVLDGYGTWLLKQGYSTDRACEYFRAAPRLARALVRRGVRTVADLAPTALHARAPADSRQDPDLAALVRQLDRYVRSELSVYAAPTVTRIAQRVADYSAYLAQVRGFARATCTSHGLTVAEFLTFLRYERIPARLGAVTGRDVERFLGAVSPRHTRASLQHVVAHLRAFLRFLVSTGERPAGLEIPIDTPRVYRGEQLPRALPWKIVQTFLHAIDRTTPMGRRDYAMFLLIATYGLRACEVVTLTLEDVDWRGARLRVPQRKTRGSIWLPLTDEIGTALLTDLRHGRSALAVRRQRVPFRGGPPPLYRELFLRHRTPAGVLKPSAVAEAFQAWSRRSGLAIPFQGPHCLRHYLASLTMSGGLGSRSRNAANPGDRAAPARFTRHSLLAPTSC